eukprot:TRINITY_DN882_c0_g3_i1.p1 TRINITY_DN882_c0_g3~~TRINITY_DN882_c0_g3_i1.p1  ORF type:complete len:713 (-),score=95.64 TRINITY_DN882_c0_g3_i1:122-2260(-)
MTADSGWGPADVIVLVLYFALLVGVTIWISHTERKREIAQGGAKSDDYFLASRDVPWWAVAASLFASNIGAEHFVGLAGTAAYSGIAVGWFEWGAIPCLLLLGFFFLPVYLRSRIATMPDWVEQRYSPFCRTFLVVLSLALYVFTKISVTLYAGQIIISEISHLNHFASLIVLIVGTTAYTAATGLAGVIYTEVVQTVILLLGGVSVLAVSMNKVGGIPGMREAISTSAPEFFHLFRPADDSSFPWVGFLTGYYAFSVWYWACDQVIVQRALAAKNIEQGAGGCVGGAFLKLLPGFIMVLPGMAARVLMEEQGIVGPTSASTEFDRAFPWLVMNVMPINTRGFIIASMLAGLMSALASVFNSSSTIFTINIYQRLRPSASEAELIRIGRFTVVGMALLSILWLPIIPLFGTQIFIYAQKPTAFVTPPILAIFVWGLLWRRANARGAELTLTLGVGIGAVRFFLEIVEGATNGSNSVIHAIVANNFMYYALGSFVLSSLMLLICGYVLPQDREWGSQSERLLWSHGLYTLLMSEAEEGPWEHLANPEEPRVIPPELKTEWQLGGRATSAAASTDFLGPGRGGDGRGGLGSPTAAGTPRGGPGKGDTARGVSGGEGDVQTDVKIEGVGAYSLLDPRSERSDGSSPGGRRVAGGARQEGGGGGGVQSVHGNGRGGCDCCLLGGVRGWSTESKRGCIRASAVLVMALFLAVVLTFR